MAASAGERLESFVCSPPSTMTIGDATHPGAKRAVAQPPLLHQDGFSQTQRGAGWSSPASGVKGGWMMRWQDGCPDRVCTIQATK